MATISPQGKFRALDSLGNPLNGGLVYTYEAGTSTPKTSYTDTTEVTANANPLVLDSEGYGHLWLASGSYKIVVKNNLGIEQWTEDNVSGQGQVGFLSTVLSKSASFSLTSDYKDNFIECTATLTITMLPSATAKEGFAFTIKNNGSGTVTLDPDGSETIDGNATMDLLSGEMAIVVSDGSNWLTAGALQDNIITLSMMKGGSNDVLLGYDASGNPSEITGGTNITVTGGTVDCDLTTATTTTEGVVELATDTEVATGTDTSRVAPVSAMGSHQGSCKAWVNLNGTGTIAIRDSFNVSSIDDLGIGHYRANFTTAMANTDFCAIATSGDTFNRFAEVHTYATTSIRVMNVIGSLLTTADCLYMNVAVFGDQ